MSRLQSIITLSTKCNDDGFDRDAEEDADEEFESECDAQRRNEVPVLENALAVLTCEECGEAVPSQSSGRVDESDGGFY